VVSTATSFDNWGTSDKILLAEYYKNEMDYVLSILHKNKTYYSIRQLRLETRLRWEKAELL